MAGRGLVGKLSIALTANTAKFEKGMSRAQKVSRGFSRGLKLAAAGAVAGMALLVKQQMKVIDATAKLAARIGESTENIVGLQHAAEITGAGAEKMAAGLNVLDKRLGEAAMGMGEGKAALDKLGLSVGSLLAMKPAERFRTIAEATSRLGTQAEKSAVASKLFSRANQDLVNTLDLGRKGLDAMQKEAKDLGMTFSRIEAKKIEEANDAITRMKGASAGLGTQIAIGIAPGIEALADLTSWFGKGIKLAGRLTAESREAAMIDEKWADATAESERNIAALKAKIDAQEAAAAAAKKKVRVELAADLKKIQKLHAERLKEGAAFTRGLWTEQEQLNDRLDTANALFRDGAIDVETWNRAYTEAAQSVARLKDEMSVEDLAGRIAAMDEMLRSRTITLEEHEGMLARLGGEAYESALQRQSDLENRITEARKRKEKAAAEQIFNWKLGAAQNWSGALKTFTSINAKESKKAFEINKAASIADASVNMGAGMMRAWKDLPHWAAIPAIAMIGASGAREIARIKNTTFGGGGGGAAPAPAAGAAGGEAGGITHMFNVHIEGESVSAEQVRELIGTIGEELGDGVKFRTS